jgi:hypothetical protein
MGIHACNPRYSEAEVGESWYEASLGKNERLCLKNKSKKG